MNGDSTIVTRGLRRDFGDRVAVESLDLDVRAGEIYGLLGPNGSGKTTTVRMLTTLIPPTAGMARVAGADVVTQQGAVRSRIGAVLQQVGLDPLMTTRQLVRLQATVQGVRSAEIRPRTAEVIGLFGLDEHADRPVGKLSGGLRRRVDLAVALVHRPRVLFLDEPTTGLDPQSRRDLWAEIKVRRDEGVTILLTTQYLDEAERMADRVGLLAAGRLVDAATPAELTRRVGQRRLALRFSGASAARRAADLLVAHGEQVDVSDDLNVRVRLPEGDEAVAGRLLALASAGLEIDAMRIEEPTLEDAFFTLAVAA